FERENLVLDEIMDGQENVFTIGAQHVAKRIAFSIHGEDWPCDLGIAQHRQSRLGQQDWIIGIGEEQGLELDGLRSEKVGFGRQRLLYLQPQQLLVQRLRPEEIGDEQRQNAGNYRRHEQGTGTAPARSFSSDGQRLAVQNVILTESLLRCPGPW